MDNDSSDEGNRGNKEYRVYFLSDSKPAYFEKNHEIMGFVKKNNDKGRFFDIHGYYEDSIDKFISLIDTEIAAKRPDLIVLHFTHGRYKAREGELESLLIGKGMKVLKHNPNNGFENTLYHIKKELKINI